MLIIHYPKSFKALDGFVDAYNEKAATQKERLKSGVMLTAKELVRIYGISLLKASNCAAIDLANLPSLQTNNQQLAGLVKCSARTIQRYLGKLALAGVITCKVFHGSNANYELWINPDILFINTRDAVNKTVQTPKATRFKDRQMIANAGFSDFQKTNCRHTYPGNTGNKENNIIRAVDNSDVDNRPSLTLSVQSNGDGSGNTGEIALKNFESKKNCSAKIEGAGEIASRAERQCVEELVTARGNSLKLYVDLFWLMARNLLYKNADLTANQVLTAKRLIAKLYEPAETSRLDAWHKIYTDRISLVYKYVQRDPQNRFVPLPYIYFDTNNPKGFVATKQWYIKNLARKQETMCELALSQMIRLYANNDRKDADRKKPALQLFRQCENRLGKLGGPALTNRFYAAVIHHEGYQRLSPTAS